MDRFLLVNGVIAAQTPNVVSAFQSILLDFDLIIEIGFNRGAFTDWLFMNKHINAKLISYDTTYEWLEVNNESIDFRLGDCFDPKIIQEIECLIKDNGKTLLLCDGGDKTKEFNLYSNFLKTGDVIMCHDYAHNIDEYYSIISSINWETAPESSLESIKDSVKINNLKPYHYDMFKHVLWGSFIKI